MGAKFIGSAGPKTTIFSFELIDDFLSLRTAFGLAKLLIFCYIAAA
jgi:hypothetical protein